MNYTLLTFLVCVAGTPVFSQDTIRLKNPSFEGAAKYSTIPKFWMGCTFEGQNLSDLQPGIYGVNLPAMHGNTYVGLVARDNDTWEGICQQLEKPMKKDSVYAFNILLAHEDTFISVSQKNLKEGRLKHSAFGVTLEEFLRREWEEQAYVNYDVPVVLRIWGGNQLCGHDELLAVSIPVSNTKWKQYHFELHPQQNDYHYLSLEAYYKDTHEPVYNGNLMLDACSPIIQINKNRH